MKATLHVVKWCMDIRCYWKMDLMDYVVVLSNVILKKEVFLYKKILDFLNLLSLAFPKIYLCLLGLRFSVSICFIKLISYRQLIKFLFPTSRELHSSLTVLPNGLKEDSSWGLVT